MKSLSPSISLESVTENGFVLPNGYSWDVKFQNGMKEGKVTVRNKMRMVYAVLFYYRDKLNGLCSFYDRGKLIKEVTFVNNIAEGWSCEIGKGGVESWFIYKNGKKVITLVKCEELEGFWNEIVIDSNNLISICQYNEEHVKNGKCYLYEGNSIRKIVSFENGKEKDCYKEFNGEEMTEYDKGGKECYIGGYEDCLKTDYPRNGEGSELKDGECIYYGNWKNNKRDGFGSSLFNGFVYYEGEWKENVPDGEGELNDENGKLKYKRNWVNGQLKLNENEWFDYASNKIVKKEDVKPVVVEPKPVELIKMNISTGNELMSLLNDEEKKKNVSELVIEEGCGNELKIDLKICGFENLKKLIVKKNSLKNLNSLVISNNEELESIVTEDGDGGWSGNDSRNTGAFYYVKSVEITSIF